VTNFESADELGPELLNLQRKAQTLTKDELDRDLAELSNDIDFLERQIRADLASYSPEELSAAHRMIACINQKVEILKIELAKRN